MKRLTEEQINEISKSSLAKVLGGLGLIGSTVGCNNKSNDYEYDKDNDKTEVTYDPSEENIQNDTIDDNTKKLTYGEGWTDQEWEKTHGGQKGYRDIDSYNERIKDVSNKKIPVEKAKEKYSKKSYHDKLAEKYGVFNYDNRPFGKMLNYVENKDSLGFDKKNHLWYPAPHPYDKKNYGMGVDRIHNGYIQKKFGKNGNKLPITRNTNKGNFFGDSRYFDRSMTEDQEFILRMKSIGDVEKATISVFAEAFGKEANKLTKYKKVKIMSMMYNKGISGVRSLLFSDKKTENFVLNSTDKQFSQYIDKINVYNGSGRNKEEDDFIMKHYPSLHDKSITITYNDYIDIMNDVNKRQKDSNRPPKPLKW